MKPRFKIGQKVKIYKAIHPLDIEYKGKIFTIASNYEGCGKDSTWYTLENVPIGFREDQLKPFCPTRTGKFRRSNGTFISENQFAKESAFSKAAQEQRDHFSYEEPNKSGKVHTRCEKCLGIDGCMCALFPNKTATEVSLDSKQRNYQKILTKLDEIEKKIDELGRRV